MILGTLAHVALSIPLFALGYGAAVLGAPWGGALAVVLYWLGRELAQSMRPGAPFAFAWTLTNTLNFGVPSGLALLWAAGFALF